MEIIGFGGSPRRGGNSAALLEAILEGARGAGADTESYYLADMLYSSCVGCERCRKDKICTKFVDGMTVIYPRIIKARGLVLASPAHNYNVTALMKAFIDRLYCFYDFTDDRPRAYSSRLADQGRKAVITGVGEQPDPHDMGATLDMMRLPLQALGYEIAGLLPVYGVFDAGLVKKQDQVMEQARQMGADLAGSLSD
jgi:multimeric flavodoxin WrbA